MLSRDPKKLFPHDYVMRYVVIPLIPHWVTPNTITMIRFVGIPFVLYFLFIEMYTIGVPLFLFMAFTDAVDGSLARIRKQITNWGTFYDPVADKLLIGSVVLLVLIKFVNPLLALLIVFIELLIAIGGYRARFQGKIMSANVFGKTKMFLQVSGVTLVLLAIWSGVGLFIPLSIGTLSLAVVFAVLSLLTYGL